MEKRSFLQQSLEMFLDSFGETFKKNLKNIEYWDKLALEKSNNFKKFRKQKVHLLVKTVKYYRNCWAHFQEISMAEVCRAVESMDLLLKEFGIVNKEIKALKLEILEREVNSLKEELGILSEIKCVKCNSVAKANALFSCQSKLRCKVCFECFRELEFFSQCPNCLANVKSSEKSKIYNYFDKTENMLN